MTVFEYSMPVSRHSKQGLALSIVIILAGVALLFWQDLPTIIRWMSGGVTVFFGILILRRSFGSLNSLEEFRTVITSAAYRQTVPRGRQRHDTGKLDQWSSDESFEIAIQDLVEIQVKLKPRLESDDTYFVKLRDGKQHKISHYFGNPVTKIVAHLKTLKPELVLRSLSDDRILECAVEKNHLRILNR